MDKERLEKTDWESVQNEQPATSMEFLEERRQLKAALDSCTESHQRLLLSNSRAVSRFHRLLRRGVIYGVIAGTVAGLAGGWVGGWALWG